MIDIDKPADLIKFILELVADEFDYMIDYIEPSYYFTHGGCYELAQIIKYYFTDAEYVVRYDFEHCAIMYQDKIYDAYDGLSIEERKKLNIQDDSLIKDKNDFTIYSKKEIDEFERPICRFNTGMVDCVINEINNISTVKIKTKKYAR